MKRSLHSFKIHVINLFYQDGEEGDSDDDWKLCKDIDSDTDEDMAYEEEESEKDVLSKPSRANELASV